jgi:DNA mismatch endonuclease (patch repair protein)
MPDIFTKAKRSEMMSRIRGKDTQPELRVRKYLHAAGCRYRLHDSKLPGKPDLVFAGRRICLFIHGCFWHGCPKCSDGRRKPKSNRAYWLPKIRRNKRRDIQHTKTLRASGWKVFVIWECEISNLRKMQQLVYAIMESKTKGTKWTQKKKRKRA